MKTHYEFKTKRLGFRPLSKKDIENLRKGSETQQFVHPDLQNQEQIMARLTEFIDQFESQGLPCFAIFELESNEFAGGTGFGMLDSGEIEICYVFMKKFWGNGYATETLEAIIKWAKKNIKADYLIGYTLVEHVAAHRVMEKCGMEYFKTDESNGVTCKFYRIKLH